MNFSVSFKRNGNFHHAVGDVPHPFHRSGGRPVMVVAPGHRLKAWGTDLDSLAELVINGISIEFENVGNHFRFYMTEEQSELMLNPPVPVTRAVPSEEEDKESDKVEKAIASDAVVELEPEPEPVRNLSPLANAYPRYRAMRHERWNGTGYSNLSNEKMAEYLFSRANRNYTNWFHRNFKDDLLARMAESEDETDAWIEKWEEFMNWMREYVAPNVERFETLRGYPTTGTRTLWYGKHQGVSENSQYFNADIRFFNGVMSKFQARIDAVVEQLEMVDDDHFDSFLAELESAGSSLGLNLHETWLPGEDGAVWFTDPDTGKNYFTKISSMTYAHSDGRLRVLYNVTDTFGIRQYPLENWRNHTWSDLGQTVLSKGWATDMDLLRYFKDYFGAFDSYLRPYMEAAASPPPFPWE